MDKKIVEVGCTDVLASAFNANENDSLLSNTSSYETTGSFFLLLILLDSLLESPIFRFSPSSLTRGNKPLIIFLYKSKPLR